ncbi:hypothetical protein H0H81_007704 [Sphagnurus paluster]|uniref:Uncharacterized protein n=1 Tax=Sphagnurus paluster TaxID=117069 RepID=A0A9P7FXA7_9AGAR|nr:hypothetical protein H0H81_007704 [Sphagnurus paluster]
MGQYWRCGQDDDDAWIQGTQLTWIGYNAIEHPANISFASFSVDGGPPTPFLLSGHSSTEGNSTYNQVLFTTPSLPPGSHYIVVTYNGSPDVAPLTLDYIYLSTATELAAATSSSPNCGVISVGVIVGGTLGGVALALLAFGLFFFIFSGKRRRPISFKRYPKALEHGGLQTTPLKSELAPAPHSPSKIMSHQLGSETLMPLEQRTVPCQSSSAIESQLNKESSSDALERVLEITSPELLSLPILPSLGNSSLDELGHGHNENSAAVASAQPLLLSRNTKFFPAADQIKNPSGAVQNGCHITGQQIRRLPPVPPPPNSSLPTMSSSDSSCYTVVFESSAEYPSAAELRSGLEKGSDEVKLDTLRKIVISTINGNPQAGSIL